MHINETNDAVSPTAKNVRNACHEFDEKEKLKEQALAELFTAYPSNVVSWQVLLKISAVNQLYATFIYYEALEKLADHICNKRIDPDLETGSPNAVTKIADAPVGMNGADRSAYSFATKYCNWHKPRKYPIYDSAVHKYLWRLQKTDSFSTSLSDQKSLRDYHRFAVIMTEFQDFYHLGSFTVKEIDKFLWQTRKSNNYFRKTNDSAA